MSIRREACYVLVCDDCAGVAEDDEGGYILHFGDDREALDYAEAKGWAISDSSHIRCRLCAATHLCARFGHDLGPWVPCICQGGNPEHAETGCGLFRVCTRCFDHNEYVILADLPTAPDPISGN